MATINSAQNLDIDSVGALSMNASGGPIHIGDDAVSQDINVGTGAVPREITIGNQAGESSIRLNSGTGGVQLQSARDVVVTAQNTTFGRVGTPRARHNARLDGRVFLL